MNESNILTGIAANKQLHGEVMLVTSVKNVENGIKVVGGGSYVQEMLGSLFSK